MYNFPDVLLMDPRIVCRVAVVDATVSPPLVSVMPLAVASAADQTEVAPPAAMASVFDACEALPLELVAVTRHPTDVPPSALTVMYVEEVAPEIFAPPRCH
jgi:hypothetical protein